MTPRTRRLVTLAVLLGLIIVVIVATLTGRARAEPVVTTSSDVAPAAGPAVDGWSTVCRFRDPRLTEISGMTYSQRHRGVVYVHNDSSGGPYVYAIDTTTCRTIARLEIRGIRARDLEAIGSGRDRQGRAILWLADTGDNRVSWPSVRLHRIREPAVLVDRAVQARTFEFRYPDGSYDAEAILADPDSTRVWVVTKQSAVGRMYRVEPRRGRTVVAKPVRPVGAFVTDGSISPDGSRFALRDYVDALVYPGMPPGQRPTRVYLPLQLQGEAITWAPDGSALLVASERDDRLLRVDPARAAAPTP